MRTYEEGKYDHEEAVARFFADALAADPERVRAVAEKYPTITRDRLRAILARERCVGLLGLEPCDIPLDVARRHGLESIYEEDN